MKSRINYALPAQGEKSNACLAPRGNEHSSHLVVSETGGSWGAVMVGSISQHPLG